MDDDFEVPTDTCRCMCIYIDVCICIIHMHTSEYIYIYDIYIYKYMEYMRTLPRKASNSVLAHLICQVSNSRDLPFLSVGENMLQNDDLKSMFSEAQATERAELEQAVLQTNHGHNLKKRLQHAHS